MARHRDERPLGALLAPDILTLLDESPVDVAVETEELHPADLADVAEALPRDKVRALLDALGPERAASVVAYLDEDFRNEVLEGMTPEDAAEIVTELSPDDRADVLEELDEETKDEILEELPVEKRRATQALLAFDPDSAGGLMTTEFVSVNERLTAEEALTEVRTIARGGRKEMLYAVYVVDDDMHIRGVLSLKELLAAPEGAKLADIMWTEVRHVHTSSDREEVARLTTEYDLVAVPVVDDKHEKLVGVVTVDDVIDAIQEEQTEDVQKLGGMEALDEPYMQISIGGMLKKRAGWLSILMVSEMFTTSALQHFDGELQKLPVLMLFVPLVMSGGGNSGSQATSLVTRAMALKEVEIKDWWRVALRELPSGIVLGSLLGFIGVIRILAWQYMFASGVTMFGDRIGYDYSVGGVPYQLVAVNVFFSMIGIVTFGSLAGSMLPFALRRMGFDPASASAPFVATLVDVTGLIIYFTVALVVLGKYMG
ncbi:MAG: magnesium transporter [Gemmatimonadetes bacterium]|nr:magnesium transporter [Gemmatimonadota bacterium]